MPFLRLYEFDVGTKHNWIIGKITDDVDNEKRGGDFYVETVLSNMYAQNTKSGCEWVFSSEFLIADCRFASPFPLSSTIITRLMVKNWNDFSWNDRIDTPRWSLFTIFWDICDYQTNVIMLSFHMVITWANKLKYISVMRSYWLFVIWTTL